MALNGVNVWRILMILVSVESWDSGLSSFPEIQGFPRLGPYYDSKNVVYWFDRFIKRKRHNIMTATLLWSGVLWCWSPGQYQTRIRSTINPSCGNSDPISNQKETANGVNIYRRFLWIWHRCKATSVRFSRATSKSVTHWRRWGSCYDLVTMR